MGFFEGPGFGIFVEKGREIRDCNFERHTGIDDFTKRDSGNYNFFWKSGLKMYKKNQAVIFGNVGNGGTKGWPYHRPITRLKEENTGLLNAKNTPTFPKVFLHQGRGL